MDAPSSGNTETGRGLQFDLGGTTADSTTSDPQQTLEPLNSASSPHTTDPLTKTLTEDFTRMCLYSSEQIAEIIRKPHDVTSMDHEQLWLDCATKLTNIIQQIIEFAKMVPGFMKLSQDDPIMLLKAGCFEMSVLRMSRLVDTQTGYVKYGEIMIPPEAFTTADTTEMKLVHNTFEMAKSLAELKLTESELALYSSIVLLSPDRPGLKNVLEVRTLRQAILKSLLHELDQTHQLPYRGYVLAIDFLLAKMTDLRELSMLHTEALARFRRSSPHIYFPDLHDELFRVEIA